MKTSLAVPALAQIAERVIRGVPSEGYAHHGKLHVEVLRLRQSVAALGSVHATPNPLETPAVHTKRLNKSANLLAAEVRAANDRANAIVRDGLNDLEKRILSKVKLQPNEFAAEIRSMFRGLDTREKTKLLNELVRDNKGAELAAIVKASPILTGLDAATLSQYENSIIALHAPEEYAERASLMEAFSATLTAASLAGGVAADYSDPAKLAEIEKAEAAAKAADASFETAINGGSFCEEE